MQYSNSTRNMIGNVRERYEALQVANAMLQERQRKRARKAEKKMRSGPLVFNDPIDLVVSVAVNHIPYYNPISNTHRTPSHDELIGGISWIFQISDGNDLIEKFYIRASLQDIQHIAEYIVGDR